MLPWRAHDAEEEPDVDLSIVPRSADITGRSTHQGRQEGDSEPAGRRLRRVVLEWQNKGDWPRNFESAGHAFKAGNHDEALRKGGRSSRKEQQEKKNREQKRKRMNISVNEIAEEP